MRSIAYGGVSYNVCPKTNKGIVLVFNRFKWAIITISEVIENRFGLEKNGSMRKNLRGAEYSMPF